MCETIDVQTEPFQRMCAHLVVFVCVYMVTSGNDDDGERVSMTISMFVYIYIRVCIYMYIDSGNGQRQGAHILNYELRSQCDDESGR